MDEPTSFFERMLDEWQHRIFAFSLALAGNHADAEEIAQDTFVRAHRALASYPPERRADLNQRAWLHQIALNVFRNRIRRRRPVLVDLAAVPEPAALRPGPAAIAEGNELRSTLRRLILDLPPRQREAVVLRHVQELSFGEAAAVLDQPEGTVRSNAHRGVMRLRRQLEEWEVVSGVG